MPSKAATPALSAPAVGGEPSPADPTRELPFAFTSFNAPPPINAKNVASQYLRTEQQSWTGRNPLKLSHGAAALMRQKKRKRAEEKDPAAADDEMAVDESEVDDEDDEEEDEAQQVLSTASHTIVIHPGSRHLRIGLASDLAPLTVPHVLARRDKLTATVAARAKEVETTENKDVDSPELDRDEQAKRRAQGTDALRNDLKSIMRNMKLRPVANGRQQTANYNAGVKPEKLAEHQDVFAIDWTESGKTEGDMVWGEKSERLDSFSKSSKPDAELPWKRFQPFDGGHLNYHAYAEHYGASSASQALAKDIATIWSHAMQAPKDVEKESASQVVEEGLGIPKSDWQFYNVLLVVSDLYLLAEVELMVNVLLVEMGFAAVMLQQESVCATFGAGLSSACVIHVGSETTQIACVDEGLVVPDSRVRLAYGGEQISAYFLHLLQRANFPYADIDIQSRLADQWLANELKERLCTLDPTQMGLIINEFHVRLPGKATLKFSLRTYDEVLVGAMCLFNTQVIPFPTTRRDLLPISTTALITDDEIDEAATGALPVTLAMTNCVRHLLPVRPPTPPPAVPQVSAEASNPSDANAKQANVDGAAKGPAKVAPEDIATPKVDDASAAPSQRASPVPPPNGAAGKQDPQSKGPTSSTTATATAAGNGVAGAVVDPDASAAAAAKPADAPSGPKVDVLFESSKVALDWAVWNSILASVAGLGAPAQVDERMKRMVTNMFCTAGTALLPGLGMAIEARLHNYISQWFTQQGKDLATLPSASVVPPPRDMDPRIVTWKGTAVLARLDSVQDAWMSRDEWKMFGMRALREKTFFM